MIRNACSILNYLIICALSTFYCISFYSNQQLAVLCCWGFTSSFVISCAIFLLMPVNATTKKIYIYIYREREKLPEDQVAGALQVRSTNSGCNIFWACAQLQFFVNSTCTYHIVPWYARQSKKRSKRHLCKLILYSIWADGYRELDLWQGKSTIPHNNFIQFRAPKLALLCETFFQWQKPDIVSCWSG